MATSVKTTTKGQRIRRHARVRAKVVGTSGRPRLSVFRSSRFIYAQVIDDGAGKTLLSASSRGKTGSVRERAHETGMEIAKKAAEKKIQSVVFDRGGFLYGATVQALADGARKGGLTF